MNCPTTNRITYKLNLEEALDFLSDEDCEGREK